MKYMILAVITMSYVSCLVANALASEVQPYFKDGPQDTLFLNLDLQWHELGNNFPSDELIKSNYDETDMQSCFESQDDQSTPNYVITITNLTPTYWKDLHYVADLGHDRYCKL